LVLELDHVDYSLATDDGFQAVESLMNAFKSIMNHII
jgi:hypothetical protein